MTQRLSLRRVSLQNKMVVTFFPRLQYLFLMGQCQRPLLSWDIRAHTMLMCPVVLLYFVDSSIICSAGVDGVANLWNWETGECIFSHTNTADFGPIEASERGKSFGYLVGEFYPMALA